MASFMVVEDDLSIRYLLRSLLAAAGHKVLAEVDQADMALRHMEAGRVPDVILLDVVLPGGPGYAIIDSVREKYGSVKIALVTAVSEERLMNLFPPVRYDAYLQKPFSSAAFKTSLSSLLSA